MLIADLFCANCQNHLLMHGIENSIHPRLSACLINDGTEDSPEMYNKEER